MRLGRFVGLGVRDLELKEIQSAAALLLLVKVRVTVVGPLGFGCVKVSFAEWGLRSSFGDSGFSGS